MTILTKSQVNRLTRLLYESYRKTDTTVAKPLVQNLYKFTIGEIGLSEFSKYQEKVGIGFDLINNFDVNDEFKPCFDPITGMIVIAINWSMFKKVSEGEIEFLQELENLVKYTIAHEDTHKQQFMKYNLYSLGYVSPDVDIVSEELSQKEVRYFSQTIEADAYGREIGEMLRLKYPNSNVKDIFKSIYLNDAPSFIMDKIRIYRDSRISRKAFQHFWRAVYDYLIGEDSTTS